VLVADVVHFAADGVKTQRIFVEKMEDGRWQFGIGIVEPAFELVVADDERHPVVDGRNARITSYILADYVLISLSFLVILRMTDGNSLFLGPGVRNTISWRQFQFRTGQAGADPSPARRARCTPYAVLGVLPGTHRPAPKPLFRRQGEANAVDQVDARQRRCF